MGPKIGPENDIGFGPDASAVVWDLYWRARFRPQKLGRFWVQVSGPIPIPELELQLLQTQAGYDSGTSRPCQCLQIRIVRRRRGQGIDGREAKRNSQCPFDGIQAEPKNDPKKWVTDERQKRGQNEGARETGNGEIPETLAEEIEPRREALASAREALEERAIERLQ